MADSKSYVYEIVTKRILEKMKRGVIPWHKPWKGLELPANLITKKSYRGINVFNLLLADYSSPYWLTFRQCQELGGRIKKSQHGTIVVYWNWKEKEVVDQNGELQKKRYALLRYYLVFNIEQTEGLEKHIPQTQRLDFKPIEEAERIVKGYRNCPEIKYNKQQAFYIPSLDYINLPKKEAFDSVEEIYSTLFHEIIHSTGHESKLNRKGITEASPFGTENYSKEELIAELGCAYLCGIAGIENKTINNSAAYLQGWLKQLENDSKLIVQAAAQAQRAVDYVLEVTVKENEKEPEQDGQIQYALAA